MELSSTRLAVVHAVQLLAHAQQRTLGVRVLHSLRALLAQQQWVLPRQRELERQAFDDFFRSHALNPPAAQIETTSTVLMKSMVMQSDALTFVPRELIYWEERARQLRALPVAGVEWVRPVGMTRRRQGALSPASRFVMECLRSVAAQHF
jgi:DNA-binding transcriptional LysR family regulator